MRFAEIEENERTVRRIDLIIPARVPVVRIGALCCRSRCDITIVERQGNSALMKLNMLRDCILEKYRKVGQDLFLWIVSLWKSTLSARTTQ
eukprot:1962684-Amphidinium_carterae.1